MKKRVISLTLAAMLLVGALPLKAEAAKKDDSMFENYVTIEGSKLMDGDDELRFISLNYPQATSDNEWEHANAMKTINAMGGNVTRTYTIPVANGSNETKAYVTGVKDGKLIFNEDALNELDDVLAKANKYGVRVIIPLVDHWHWVGGIDGYVWLAGESDGNAPSNSSFQDWAWKFYSSETCRDYFKQMIAHLMERENTVTGVKYKDDKAILCWETANEAGGNPGNQSKYDDVLTDWNKDITDFIHSKDKNHLVLDGRMSTTEKSRKDNPADILGAHYYEGNYATRCGDETKLVHEAGKPFILGEFGGKVKAEPCIDVFQAGLDNQTNGIMMWSLRAHKDGFGYYFHDEDGYWASYHWPGFEAGDYYGETEILRAIYAYAQIVNGNAANYAEAKNIPIPAPETDEAPLLYSADSENSHDKSFLNGSVGEIKWRGVVGGAWYEIQRAEGKVTKANADDAKWLTIADEKDYVYDSGRNWEDKNHDCIAGYHDMTAIDGKTYSYRLRACNESGKGLWSNIVTVENANHVVVDELDLISVASDDPNPTEVRNTISFDHSANVKQSGSTIYNSSDREGYIEYKAIIPLKEMTITAVSEVATENEPKVYVSNNGISYEHVELTHENGTKEYKISTDSEDSYYVRIYIPGKSRCKLDETKLTYVNDGKHYLDEDDLREFKSNVMIQDNSFDDSNNNYVFKDSTSLIYKTKDDINAIRVKAKGEVTVEYSYDGIAFTAMEGKNQGELVSFSSFNLPGSTRVVKINYNDISDVKAVEISSGTKSIPAAESSPANIMEDGEYYFGSDDNLKAAFKCEVIDGAAVFTKALDNGNYEAYDSLYGWFKGSGYDVSLKLTDVNGKTFITDKLAITSTGELSKVKLDSSKVDLANIKKLSIIVSGKEIDKCDIALDSSNKFTGNFGLKLTLTLSDGSKDTVYADCIYANSSTKVDDFEGYGGSNSLLAGAFSRNTNGGQFDISLDSQHASEGGYAMRIDYDYQGKGYAGAAKKMDLLNLDGYDGFYMYLYGDGSDNDLKLQVETDVSTFAYTGYLSFEGGKECFLPFDGFKECDWAGSGHELDSSNNLKSVAIYTDKTGSVESGTFYIDDLRGSNYVEGACDLLARKEKEEVTPEDGENFDNVVFKWDFAEDGTEGWSFEGFTPWIENGNLCAWSQDEYQATFSYEIENVPNGTYALMNDIKVKSNMRNVQAAISSGENELKSDAIDTADVLEQDMIIDGRLEVKDHKVTITYYLDSPKDENGTTFMVGDIKLICVKEEVAEESSEDGTDAGSGNESENKPEEGTAGDSASNSSVVSIADGPVPTSGQVTQTDQIEQAVQKAKDTSTGSKAVATIVDEDVPESAEASNDEKISEDEASYEDSSADVEAVDNPQDADSEAVEDSSSINVGFVIAACLILAVFVGLSVIFLKRKS